MNTSKRKTIRIMKQHSLYILFTLLIVSTQAIGAVSYINDKTTHISDSVTTSEVSKKIYRAENYGKDARVVAFQRRYRIPDEEFSNSDFLSHLYIGAGVSVEKISRREDNEYGSAPVYTFLIGKDISKSHSLSLAFRTGENSINNSDIILKRYGVQLNHHFYLTRCFLNYNPKRIFDISTTAGIGYQKSKLIRKEYGSVYGMFGIRGTLRLCDRMHMAIEPYACISSEGYSGLEKGKSSYGYNDSYGIGMSLIYTFKDELNKNISIGDSLPYRNYMFFETGPQALHSNIGFSNTIGHYFALGYGLWFDRRFALQFSTGYSNSTWGEYKTPADINAGHPEYRFMAKTQYFFGCAEFVTNILTLPEKSNSRKMFSLDWSAGYEYGFQWKYSNTIEQISCYYGGLTSAIKIKWMLPENKALYLSPRITFVNFDVPYKEPYEYIERKYTDKKFNLAIGLEFGLKRKTDYETADETEISEDLRFPHSLDVSVSFGNNYVLERGYYKGDNTFNTIGALAVEYQPFKYFGIRAKADYSTHKFNLIRDYTETIENNIFYYEGLWKVKYNVINGMFDLKFDISNMIHGYNTYRKWNMALYTGMVISKHIKTGTKINKGELTLPGSTINMDAATPQKPLIGIHAAANCRYSITGHLGVFGELGVKIHRNAFLSAEHLDYNPIRVIDMELGLSYKIR